MSPLDLVRIRREAGVAAVEYHEELDSTNTRAMELAALGGDPLPVLVITDRQRAGRGRGLNRWWSAPGSLTFSVLTDCHVPGVPTRNWPLVSLATALAVAESIEKYVPAGEVRLKWPNDVFLRDRKVCGILAETVAGRPASLVVGVGINVNNSLAGGPIELRAGATSLIDVSGRTIDRTELLIGVLRRMDHFLSSMGGDSWPLAEAWRGRCLLQGRTVQLDAGSERWTGVCQGIDDQGALLLLTEGGIQRCFGGTVARIL